MAQASSKKGGEAKKAKIKKQGEWGQGIGGDPLSQERAGAKLTPTLLPSL